MIRIKVVHASHILAVFTTVLLLAALCLLAVRCAAPSKTKPVSSGQAVTHMAQAAAVFAAAPFSGSAGGKRFSVEVIGQADVRESPEPGALLFPRTRPLRVLIYHTHTHEAYEQEPGDSYEALEAWRTLDPGHSVVRVGEELASCLERLGVQATHDVTDHEPPKLGTAYSRSLETLKKYDAADYDLYIDLHRDAWDESMTGAQTVTNGESEMALIMMLIGNGEGFDEKPDTQANLDLAQKLTDALNQAAPGLCRPVRVKSGRYNQHMNTPSVLVEVGHNKNTLAQALAAMPYLARAIAGTLQPE